MLSWVGALALFLLLLRVLRSVWLAPSWAVVSAALATALLYPQLEQLVAQVIAAFRSWLRREASHRG